MNKISFPFDRFRSATHRAWKLDRLRRQHVPLGECWRGCVGLALFWKDIDAGECHGDNVFYNNDDVYWGCLRDVPPGHFPSSVAMNRRSVLFASTAQATLRHSMPRLDFGAPTRAAWDLSFLPFDKVSVGKGRGQISWTAQGDVLNTDEHPREFRVFTKLSEEMTRFASSAVDERGRWIRPSWRQLLRRDFPERSFVSSPSAWFPEAFVGVGDKDADRLYFAATSRAARLTTVCQCTHCSALITEEDLRYQLIASADGPGFRCPRCQKFGRWDVEYGPAAGRTFNPRFRAGFCEALAEGLPLHAPEPLRYLGHASESGTADGPDLIAHRFASLWRGCNVTFYLPRCAAILVRAGATIDTGTKWAQLVPVPHELWSNRPLADRWTDLREICGGSSHIGIFQQLWFNAQAVRLKMHPGLVFFPASLVAYAAQEIQVRALVWELSKCEDLVDSGSEAVIFPSVRVRRWSQPKFDLCDVAVDASIGDPRFSLYPRAALARPMVTRLVQDLVAV